MDLKEKVRIIISSSKVLTEEEIELIIDTTVFKTFDKGTFLLKEGQIPRECYMVVEGCVREYMIVDGEEKSIAFYTEGDKIAAYDDKENQQPSKNYWECMEDCALTVSDQSFEDDLRKLIPRLDVVIQEVAKQKLSKAKEEWSKFISSSPEERYLNLLQNRPSLFNRVPQHQIASYLGVKPESLSRIRKRVHDKVKAGA